MISLICHYNTRAGFGFRNNVGTYKLTYPFGFWLSLADWDVTCLAAVPHLETYALDITLANAVIVPDMSGGVLVPGSGMLSFGAILAPRQGNSERSRQHGSCQ